MRRGFEVPGLQLAGVAFLSAAEAGAAARRGLMGGIGEAEGREVAMRPAAEERRLTVRPRLATGGAAPSPPENEEDGAPAEGPATWLLPLRFSLAGVSSTAIWSRRTRAAIAICWSLTAPSSTRLLPATYPLFPPEEDPPALAAATEARRSSPVAAAAAATGRPLVPAIVTPRCWLGGLSSIVIAVSTLLPGVVD